MGLNSKYRNTYTTQIAYTVKETKWDYGISMVVLERTKASCAKNCRKIGFEHYNYYNDTLAHYKLLLFIMGKGNVIIIIMPNQFQA
jgi:hypothetical protein